MFPRASLQHNPSSVTFPTRCLARQNCKDVNQWNKDELCSLKEPPLHWLEMPKLLDESKEAWSQSSQTQLACYFKMSFSIDRQMERAVAWPKFNKSLLWVLICFNFLLILGWNQTKQLPLFLFPGFVKFSYWGQIQHSSRLPILFSRGQYNGLQDYQNFSTQLP